MTNPEVKNAPNERRRQLLLSLLAGGVFTAIPLAAREALLGVRPEPLPTGKSIYTLFGDVRVNGIPASLDTLINPNDLVETGAKSTATFVVGRDAFLLRENSHLQLHAEGSGSITLSVLRLVTGKLLSVFGKSTHRLEMPTATIGIRGTGLYVESDPEQSYICTCYGTTEIRASGDARASEVIQSKHHDSPRYVLASAKSGGLIRPARFINHTDDELALIEALVGRSPPFVLPGNSYGTPRRKDY